MSLKEKFMQMFCKHDYKIVRKYSLYQCNSGEQLYKQCKKCGKVSKWVFREYEGNGYK